MSEAKRTSLFGQGETPEIDPTLGLTISRVFSEEGQDPFTSVEWDRRDACIKNHKGDKIFEQTDVEFPVSWSLLATNVVTSKYFYGELSKNGIHPNDGGRENSLQQLIHRVTKTITDWGTEGGYSPRKRMEMHFMTS